MIADKKQAYQAPVLRAHGSLEELTLGQSWGAATDAVFPAGTPKGQITFS